MICVTVYMRNSTVYLALLDEKGNGEDEGIIRRFRSDCWFIKHFSKSKKSKNLHVTF